MTNTTLSHWSGFPNTAWYNPHLFFPNTAWYNPKLLDNKYNQDIICVESRVKTVLFIKNPSLEFVLTLLETVQKIPCLIVLYMA